jgi:MFS family permease
MLPQWLLLIRFMVGIGLGGVPVAFALFAEFCPVRGRGGWLIALQAFWTFGSMAEAAIAWGVLTAAGWRVLLALSAAPFGEPPAHLNVPAARSSTAGSLCSSGQTCGSAVSAFRDRRVIHVWQQ